MKLFVFLNNELLISVEWSFFTWMDFYVVRSLPNRKFPTLINLIAWILTADILSQIFMTNKFGWFFLQDLFILIDNKENRNGASIVSLLWNKHNKTKVYNVWKAMKPLV